MRIEKFFAKILSEMSIPIRHELNSSKYSALGRVDSLKTGF